MAKVKNETGAAVTVPELGRMVLADQVIEVADELVYRFTQSPLWTAADKAAEAAHRAGERSRDERRTAESRARHGLPAVTPVDTEKGE